VPYTAQETTRYAIEIPRGLSLLAFHDPDAEVLGLTAFPPDERPNPVPVHLAFQIMVACGISMAAVAAAAAILKWKRRERLFSRPFLRAVAACGPLGLLAVEAGWVVTELGRQPWVIHKVMRTSDAVTPVGGLALPFAFFTIIYLALGVFAARFLRRELAESPFFPAEEGGSLAVPGEG
jgi:cytochrome d ubiquinol oxidase subunit I